MMMEVTNLCWNLRIMLLYASFVGLKCDCTTGECIDKGTRTCHGNYCYSETYNNVVENGCTEEWRELLCENRHSSKLFSQRVSFCCSNRDFCNKNIVPTKAPKKGIGIWFVYKMLYTYTLYMYYGYNYMYLPLERKEKSLDSWNGTQHFWNSHYYKHDCKNSKPKQFLALIRISLIN